MFINCEPPPGSNLIVAKTEQPSNADLHILRTDDGIRIDVKPSSQFAKAFDPISVRVFGKLIDFNFLHLTNDSSSMYSIPDSGKWTISRLVQLRKQRNGIHFFVIYVTDERSTTVNDLHPSKIRSPNLRIDVGRLIDFNATQSKKALVPIVYICGVCGSAGADDDDDEVD